MFRRTGTDRVCHGVGPKREEYRDFVWGVLAESVLRYQGQKLVKTNRKAHSTPAECGRAPRPGASLGRVASHRVTASLSALGYGHNLSQPACGMT
jgi:hypothetical protein